MAFATPTILGELKRHFRDRGWAVRVPRRVRERSLEAAEAVGVLLLELGRSPTVVKVAARIEASIEDTVEAMEARLTYRSMSIEAWLAEEDAWERLARRLGDEDLDLVQVEQRVTLDSLVATLPERQQAVLFLRFVRDMTQAEIAREIGVSQVQVSRLLAQALDRLRKLSAGSWTEPP